MVKIAVLVSGGGTNLQALIDAETRGELGCGKLTLCIASNDKAYALTRAQNHGMKTAVVSKKGYDGMGAYAQALLDVLHAEGIELIILAGFLTILPTTVIAQYRDRIINVHPSLIPSFCGEGFYGLKVHEAALNYGVKVTGATVHMVSEVVDGGRILLQKAVDVLEDDTPETLQKRVMQQAEWQLLPKAAAMLCDDIAREKENKN
ncbi:phosphoribosylglycinamide formyltransferase [Oscillospiraceae bacterium LTW-04]|nr:phosphoribosylglycinamide formyltransferase [Oscillospiraceae bacterium MB24-C1]